MKEECKECRFLKVDAFETLCCRFPPLVQGFTTTLVTDWCGEFKAKAVKKRAVKKQTTQTKAQGKK